jgi:hypothetical protein
VTRLVGAILLLSACNALAQAPPESTAPDLAGTSWRLVRFLGRDHGILTPDDPAKYTIEFHPDGDLTMRIDCNAAVAPGTLPSRASSGAHACHVPAPGVARSDRQGLELRSVVRHHGWPSLFCH